MRCHLLCLGRPCAGIHSRTAKPRLDTRSALQSLCKTLQVDAMVGWLLEQGGPMSS